jgi:hypothetical protein
MLATDGETCIVAMPYGPANFCSIVVKPYYTEEAPEDGDDQPYDEPHDQPYDESHDQPCNEYHDDQPEENNELTAETAEPTARNEQVQYCG